MYELALFDNIFYFEDGFVVSVWFFLVMGYVIYYLWYSNWFKNETSLTYIWKLMQTNIQSTVKIKDRDFYQNTKRLLVFNLFLQKAPSQMFDKVLNSLL